uniref:Tubulin-specific chaperone E n=1 Tax=Sinocyclocheilus anshuiensis TaxID=1608454 RepID=A0A671M0P4_9TELE
MKTQEDAVGRRVSCDGERGTVRYVGPVPPTAGVWLGVEWDDPERGKHDGSHEGVRYFTCRHPKGGSFVRPKKASFGVDYVTALKQRYEVELQEAIGEDLKISSRTVMMVGFEDVKQKQRLENLTEISLRRCEVSGPGFFNSISVARSLDLSGNLLSSWEVLAAITEQLESLQELQLSHNRLSTSSDPSRLSPAFSCLRVLSLNSSDVSVCVCVCVCLSVCVFHLSCRRNPLLQREKNLETSRQIIIARLSRLELLDMRQVLSDERRGAELDYCKMFGAAWLKAGGHSDPEKNQPNTDFMSEHPRFLALLQKYGAPDEGELREQKPFALKNQLLTVTFVCPEDSERKPIEKKLPGSMIVQKVKGLLHRLLKLPGMELKLSYTCSKIAGREIEIDNDLKPLEFYSVEDGDRILVRWS